MTGHGIVEGTAVWLGIENLDTDQIMPKQFLHGVDRAGLDKGVFHDLRFDARGAPRADCVFNAPQGRGASVLIGGGNFGCGSSREHAVWGMLQFGIRAVIAPSYGEIFFSNAMNNGLLLVTLARAQVEDIAQAVRADASTRVRIDVVARQVGVGSRGFGFEISPRHRRMFLEGLDLIQESLAARRDIENFARSHWERAPWLRDVARRMAAQAGQPPAHSDALPAHGVVRG
jgi:3-isopropylmalate/(R)-2-methylmalate dehydratase small subunit